MQAGEIQGIRILEGVAGRQNGLSGEIMLSISAQYGGPKGDKNIWPLHRQFNQLSAHHFDKAYYSKIKKLCVVLRVGGPLQKFDDGIGEGVENLDVDSEYISVDLVIPEQRWQKLDKQELREYIANGIESAFSALIDQAEKMNEILDKKSLLEDFRTVMRAFKSGA